MLARRLRERGQEMSARSVAIYGQFARKLADPGPEPWRLADAGFDLAAERADLESRHLYMILFLAVVFQLWLAVLFGRADLALALAREARGLAPAAPSMYARSLLDFYGALAIVAALERDREGATALRDELAWYTDHLAGLAASAPANHAHKLRLVEAELARVEGRDADAIRGYDEAARLALDGGMSHDAGLAAERCAAFDLACGNVAHARAMLHCAGEAYAAWGARAKVEELDARGRDLAPWPHAAAARDGASFDVETILDAAKAAAGEVRLDLLVSRLLGFAMKSAGARRAMLFLADEGGLRLNARGTADTGEITVVDGPHLDDCAGLPTSVVRFAARTRETVALADVRGSPEFIGDPFVLAAETSARLQDSNERLQEQSRDLAHRVEERTAELAQLQADRERILASVFDGIVRLDSHGAITYLNPAAERATGWKVADLLGRSHHALLVEPSDGACPLCDPEPEIPPSTCEFQRSDGRRFPA